MNFIEQPEMEHVSCRTYYTDLICVESTSSDFHFLVFQIILIFNKILM